MKETDIFPPIRDWLRGMGFDVYVEVPFNGRVIDVVGGRGDLLCAVELKVSCSRGVFYQAYLNTGMTPFTYAAVASSPTKKKAALFREYGLGLITVKGGSVKVLAEPRFKGTMWMAAVKKLSLGEPNVGIAGHPAQKGIGPRIDCAARVEKYLKEHTGAKWPEVFDNVENHYSTHNSMASAMRSYGVLLYVPDEIAFRHMPPQTNIAFLESK